MTFFLFRDVTKYKLRCEYGYSSYHDDVRSCSHGKVLLDVSNTEAYCPNIFNASFAIKRNNQIKAIPTVILKTQKFLQLNTVLLFFNKFQLLRLNTMRSDTVYFAIERNMPCVFKNVK